MEKKLEEHYPHVNFEAQRRIIKEKNALDRYRDAATPRSTHRLGKEYDKISEENKLYFATLLTNKINYTKPGRTMDERDRCFDVCKYT